MIKGCDMKEIDFSGMEVIKILVDNKVIPDEKYVSLTLSLNVKNPPTITCEFLVSFEKEEKKHELK